MEASDSTPSDVVAEHPMAASAEVPEEVLSASDLVLDEPAPPLRADATEEIAADAIIEVASALGEAPAAQLVTEVMAPLPPPAPKVERAVVWTRPFVRFAAVFTAAALLGLLSFGPLTLRVHPHPTLASSTRADVVAVRGLPVTTVASEVPMGPPRAPVAGPLTGAPAAAAKVVTPRIAALPRSPKPAPKAAKAPSAASPKAVVSTQVAVAAPRAPRTNAPSALLRSTRDRHVYF